MQRVVCRRQARSPRSTGRRASTARRAVRRLSGVTVLESALIVPVPEVEPLVGRHRLVLDPAAGWGVPAHVTVVYPFLPPAQITDDVRRTVRKVAAATPAFDIEFSRIRWFDDTVVWLSPEPAEPFRALTMSLWRRYPQAPPYRGAHGDTVTPHLTIGQGGPVEAMQAAAVEIDTQLPVRATATEMRLIIGKAEPGEPVTILYCRGELDSSFLGRSLCASVSPR
jgi:2'-5' RNA ligase superfamily